MKRFYLANRTLILNFKLSAESSSSWSWRKIVATIKANTESIKMSVKVKKTYKKNLYVIKGVCVFNKEEFDEIYGVDGWKIGYYEKVKERIEKDFQMLVTAGKKHNGERSLSIYLKCAVCKNPASFKAKSAQSRQNGASFTFSASCDCKTEAESQGLILKKING
jgi:hypothetical protein